MKTVQFQFITGLKRSIFDNVCLSGSWDANGQYSDLWSEKPMEPKTGEDGCPIFVASVDFDTTEVGKTFRWGVRLDTKEESEVWGIPTEVHDKDSTERHREFTLSNSNAQVERYYFTYGRRLGANKCIIDGNPIPRVRFAVWAPNASKVDVVFGYQERGYITKEGGGINPALPEISLQQGAEGIWEGVSEEPYEHFKSQCYMYRIERSPDKKVVYRTDIFSRSQAGRGNINPLPSPEEWDGGIETLDGSVSCSVVIDPDVVREDFHSPPLGRPDLISADKFWEKEVTDLHPSVPTNVEDLVIYELHIGSLGFGKANAGNLNDAIKFLDHLVELGVNAVELLPMAEFSGSAAWGYGDTHYFCVESSAGGRDKYRHFVRACHLRGIAVIQDVVYNHYDPNAERAQWQYDSTVPEQNIYYWYEGRAQDYPAEHEDYGYLDNGSSGYTPRFWEEVVRQQFISSAAFLLEEMHVDGLRVDLTQAIHRDNKLHRDNVLREDHGTLGSANQFGSKLLREWSRTLHLIRPTAFLIAEDHTEWPAVIQRPDEGGLGFNARWKADFYHNLIGDAKRDGDEARLLKRAGISFAEPLRMRKFADFLEASGNNQVVYHESHDEAGNGEGTKRTMVVAVNGVMDDTTRPYAEARSRVCLGLSLLSAGTPMFMMGEEVAAQNDFTYRCFLADREDILSKKISDGQRMFRFYKDIIRLSHNQPSIRTHNITILHTNDDNRVIAFKRWDNHEELIVVASLNNQPFDNYRVENDAYIPNGNWIEIFNSDAEIYGGRSVGNFSASLPSVDGQLRMRLPANGILVFAREG